VVEKQRSVNEEEGGMGDLDDEIFCNDEEMDMDMMMDDEIGGN
jgi:hypothetical protein